MGFCATNKCWGLDTQYGSIDVCGLYRCVWVSTAQCTIKKRLAKHAHGNIGVLSEISPLTQMTNSCAWPLLNRLKYWLNDNFELSTNLTILLPYHMWVGPVWSWKVQPPSESGIPFRTQPKYFTRMPYPSSTIYYIV